MRTRAPTLFWKTCVVMALAGGGLLCPLYGAEAGPYVVQGPFVTPQAGGGIPGPKNVPGKEYTANPDKDQGNVAVPGQSLLWDGAGGIMNGLVYKDATQTAREVDALANHGDVLFYEVTHQQAALLFSVSGDGRILYEKASVPQGGVWAFPADIDQHGVQDVDALEVWGPERVADGDRYSFHGDPEGTAIYELMGIPWVSTTQIRQLIGAPSNEAIDVDGLMVFGNQLLFSIAPTATFDGGEIWWWDGSAAAAQFLFHGGHLWDTAFDVKGTFGLADENVNALEAVATPEPTTLLLLGAGLLALPVLRRRKRNP